MKLSYRNHLVAAAVLLGAPLAIAQILALDLKGMLERADSAIVGTVKERNVWKGPLDSPDFIVDFTTIKVEGDDLIRGGVVTHAITFLGSESMPVSEMPSSNDTQVGTKGIFFSKRLNENWGGRKDQWSMIAAQGGAFRIEAGPKGDVVLGKGDGFAVPTNRLVSDIRTDVARELVAIKRK